MNNIKANDYNPLWAMDAGGKNLHLDRWLPSDTYGMPMAVSPDGRRAAVQGGSGVYMVRLDVPGDPGSLIWTPDLPADYPFRDPAGYPISISDGTFSLLGWSPDGQSILVSDKAAQVWRVPLYAPGPVRPVLVNEVGAHLQPQAVLLTGEVVGIDRLGDGNRHLWAACPTGLAQLDQTREWGRANLGKVSPDGRYFFGDRNGDSG